MDESIGARLKALEDRVQALELVGSDTTVRPVQPVAKKNQSPKEFLLLKNPRSATQMTLALGYFYEYESSKGAFNTADLESMFRLAKEKVPANINDMVNKNIQKGCLMEDATLKDDKKAWVLTSTGERLVENNFKEG